MTTFRGKRVTRGGTFSTSAYIQNDAIKQNHLMEESVNNPSFKAGISSILRYPTALHLPLEGWDIEPE